MDVFAYLPEHIELDLGEAAQVLTALDVGLALAAGQEREHVESAIGIITNKLWPELGDLLGEDEA